MKQLITILLCLFTLFAEAQVNTNDTNKYFKSYDYGFSYKRLQAREAFIFPTDTVINKLGAVSLNGVIYLGNGTKWTSIGGGGSSTNPQGLDSVLSVNNRAINKNMFIGTDSNSYKGFGFYLTGTSQNVDQNPELLINGITSANYGISIQANTSTNDYGKINFYNSDQGNKTLQFPIGASGSAVINLPPTSLNGTVEGDTLATLYDIRNASGTTIDTTNQFVKRLERTPGKDSIIYFVGANRFAIKDSVGGSSHNGRFGNDTATVVMVKVHNDAGVTLTNGKVVALTTSGNNNEAPAVRLANSKGDSTSANTLGFVSGTIANQDTGWVILSGKIEKINTSAYNNGDIIYLDTINGNFTKVKPSAPTHLVYLGVVVKANAGNGAIFVKAQNGYELDEIHDVQINSKLNNQIIVYSDTQKVWKNRNIYSVVDTTTTVATKTDLNNYVNLTTAQTIAGQKTFSSQIKMPTTGSNLILQILSDGTIASMASATYPTPVELAYVKGVTSAIQTQINSKVNISDTATMLSKYLRKIDTASLSNRIDKEFSDLDILQSLSFGIKAEPYGITLATTTSQLGLTSAVMNFYPFNWNVSDSIRGIAFLNRAATTLTATNYTGVGIYSLSGGTLTRLTFTPNNGTFWDNATINTWKTQAITPYYLPKGIYYLGYQVTGSAGLPTIASGTTMQAGLIEPPTAINPNGIKIAFSIANNTASAPTSVAMSATTTTQRVPYFILY